MNKKIKNLWSNHKKLICTLIGLLLIVAVTLVSLFGYAEINHHKYKKYLETVIPEFGTLQFSDIEKLGEFDNSNYNSVYATDKAKIMVFSDIHLGYLDNLSSKLGLHNKQDDNVLLQIRKAVEEEEPSLLIFLGDNIEGRDSGKEFRKFCDTVDSFGVPWTLVFGNHDGDAAIYGGSEDYWLKADKAMMANIAEKYKNSLFRSGFSVLFDNGIYTVGNDVINLFVNNNHIYNLVLMDSNSYLPVTNNQNDIRYEYDYIREEQVAWYDWATKNQDIPNMVFMHIPIAQYKSAFAGNKQKFNEVQRVDTGLFDKMKNNGATDIFAGHYHNISLDGVYENIKFHFAVTSSKKRLYNLAKAGYKLITISDDGETLTENKLFKQ